RRDRRTREKDHDHRRQLVAELRQSPRGSRAAHRPTSAFPVARTRSETHFRERAGRRTETMKTAPRPAAVEDRKGPGLASKALFDEEQRYFTPGLQSIALFSELAMERGSGCWLEDVDGRKYLDFVAGIGVASVGHAHPEYVKAISDQVAKISVGSFTTRRRLDFAKRLAGVTPKGLDRVQLYSSGAEAVEAAL